VLEQVKNRSGNYFNTKKFFEGFEFPPTQEFLENLNLLSCVGGRRPTSIENKVVKTSENNEDDVEVGSDYDDDDDDGEEDNDLRDSPLEAESLDLSAIKASLPATDTCTGIKMDINAMTPASSNNEIALIVELLPKYVESTQQKKRGKKAKAYDSVDLGGLASAINDKVTEVYNRNPTTFELKGLRWKSTAHFERTDNELQVQHSLKDVKDEFIGVRTMLRDTTETDLLPLHIPKRSYDHTSSAMGDASYDYDETSTPNSNNTKPEFSDIDDPQGQERPPKKPRAPPHCKRCKQLLTRIGYSDIVMGGQVQERFA
jgi:hypothetical protein